MISFISFLTSAIILIALQCLTLLTDADFRKDDMDELSEQEDWSAKKQMMQITMSSASFSLGLLALGAVLDRKSTTRCFSLFCFIPLTQLCIERFIFGEDQLTKVQLMCMVTLLVGTLLITLFIAQPRTQNKVTLPQNQNRRQQSIY